LPAQLDSLPRRRGFRLRGIQMTRLETFTDAAFAFAVSMLVIAAQQIPDNIASLLAAFRNVNLCLEHRGARHLLVGPLVVESALRSGRRRFHHHQLGDDCDNLDLYLPVKGNFRGDVVPSE
jgi:hypothetical protein